LEFFLKFSSRYPLHLSCYSMILVNLWCLVGTLLRFTVRASPYGSVSGLGSYLWALRPISECTRKEYTHVDADLAPDLNQRDGGQVVSVS